MPAYRPIIERLEAKTKRTQQCWVWQGAVSTSGYGVIGLPRSQKIRHVHRVAYELANGDIPDGLHIDHLCRNRLCVRPDHLEAVTQAENNRRAAMANASLTRTCIRGHAFVGENIMTSTLGRRQCRACHNLHGRARRRGLSADALLSLEGGQP